jgi:hypothetical protein
MLIPRSISMTWHPYLTIENCNEIGEECENAGIDRVWYGVIAPKYTHEYLLIVCCSITVQVLQIQKTTDHIEKYHSFPNNVHVICTDLLK